MTVRVKVLVAGNDEATAKQLTDALSPLGWEVLQARDAVSATAAMQRSRPDAVILYGQLPGGGAGLVLRRLRASVHTAMTPVIVITGRREGDADELRLHGADECVPPPADPVAIRTWIQNRLVAAPAVVEAPRAIIRDANRLAALERTALLDTPADGIFDALTNLASSLLLAPVALVSLVDADRQFFKSQVGLAEPWASNRETPLTHSFCQWVVSGHEALVVSDARQHAVLSHNRAIVDLGVVAYAGVPLTGTTGEPLGSLCAIDTKPRDWSEANIALLRDLGQIAEACIAISESTATSRRSEPRTEDDRITGALVLRALGTGIATCTNLLQRNDPRIGDAERLALLRTVEWFGRNIVQLAGG